MAPSIEQQTGWRRPHPQTLLQGWDGALELLLKVDDFDYDLSDAGFVFYATRRGLLCPATAPGAPLWQALCRPFATAAAPDYVRILRARLQDAWEMYRQPEADFIMRFYSGARAPRNAPEPAPIPDPAQVLIDARGQLCLF